MIRTFLIVAGWALAAPACAEPALPDALAAPGEMTIVTLHAVGAQIYDCKADAGGKLGWKLREPIATLMRDGKTVGRHYAGPSWALDDGGAVVGKVVANAPGATPADVAWLKLAVVSQSGAGLLDGATTVQRLDTRGGAASGACDAEDASLAVPYSANYVFLKK